MTVAEKDRRRERKGSEKERQEERETGERKTDRRRERQGDTVTGGEKGRG